MPARSNKNLAFSSGKVSRWFLALVILPAAEALVSIGLVFGAQSEGASAFFLGISATRWLLVLLLLGLAIVFGALAWLKFKRHKFWAKFEQRTLFLVNNRFYHVLVFVLIVVAVICFYTILVTFKFTDLFVLARLQRIIPLVIWLFLFSLQTIIILPQTKAAKASRINKVFDSLELAPVGITFLLLVLVAAFVHFTRLGLQPDKVGWDNPGVPLLGTQIFMALCLAGLLFGILWLLAKGLGWEISRFDGFAAILLWVIAVWSWQAQPLTPTFFSPTPRAPNYSYYPYSDAATHDLGAQNLMIGNGFPDVIEKPLYSFFLAGIHSLVGQDYQNVVFAQIVVLALFPVVLYFIGGRFHHRISGALLAFAMIFRETNAIALSGEIRVSHSKLLMTDLPAALGIAAFTLLVMKWLQSDRRNYRWLVVVGGGLGMLALLRSQTIIFLPAVFVAAFLMYRTGIQKRLLVSGIMLFGFVLALFPWSFRNYQVSGQFGYSQPLQAAYLARQYSLTPELAETGFPEGTPVSDYVSLGFSKVWQFTLGNPLDAAGFISAHFFHNEVSSLLALPMRFDFADKLVTFYNLRPYWIGQEGKLWAECCSLNSYIANTPYWQNWNGIIPSEAWLPVLLNLGLVAIGIGTAWKKVGWLAIVPIEIHILYNASTAIARVSGWRLILPVDWVLLLFYCLGVVQVLLWIWDYIGATRSQKINGDKNPRPSRQSKKNDPHWSGVAKIAAAIFFIGLLLPLSEKVIPARYQPLSEAEAQVLWDNSEFSQQFELHLEDFLSKPGAEILVGRALYPRFYAANEGEPGEQGSAFNPLPFSRMTFSLIGPVGSQVALPLVSSPAEFPNASDVFVIGCEEDAFFRASAVIFMDHLASDLITNLADPFVCN